MKIIVKFTCAVLAAAGLSGCATIINGTSQDYTIRSDPDGANVELTNGQKCVSPCKLDLKRGHDQRVDITKDGYKPAYVLVQSRTGGAAFGNILLGGVIGGVVDGSNGASNHLAPNPLNIKLARAGTAEEAELLDKKGKLVAKVSAHNDKVRADVARSIGVRAAGIAEAPDANGAVASAAVPAQTLAPASAVAEVNPGVPAAPAGAVAVEASAAPAK